jgi:hypothetical protein
MTFNVWGITANGSELCDLSSDTLAFLSISLYILTIILWYIYKNSINSVGEQMSSIYYMYLTVGE